MIEIDNKDLEGALYRAMKRRDEDHKEALAYFYRREREREESSRMYFPELSRKFTTTMLVVSTLYLIGVAVYGIKLQHKNDYTNQSRIERIATTSEEQLAAEMGLTRHAK